MSELAVVSLIIGILALVFGGAALLVPSAVRQGLEKFPRSVWPGRVLAAVDLIWAAFAVTQLHLGMFDAWKVHLYWLAPICIILCVAYLDELLSPRALGGLLLLAAGVVLNVARWHESDWRLVMSVLAYVWIGFGLLFLLEPWWFRRLALFASKSERLLRAGGLLKVLCGIGLILLALLVY